MTRPTKDIGDDMTARYQAMLATAMTLANGNVRAQAAGWRQIVDILAQAGDALDPSLRAEALARLSHLRPAIDDAERRFTAASLAGRTRDAAVVALFAADGAAVAAPLLSRVTLSDDDWETILPAMPSASRNILRNRRDLSNRAVRMLATFAPGDLALASTGAAPAIPGATQIRDLVDRIAAFRQRVPIPSASQPGVARAEHFVFEAGSDGVIDWVEPIPREALVGISLAHAASAGGVGVDGGAAGAWRRRAPVRDARLCIAGDGPAAGDWRFSAAPVFASADGRFLGYRGEGRRPLPGEQAATGEDAPLVGIAPDSIRQLIHELRTPLNAIQGFAEMIDGQILGPAAHYYREHATRIVEEARRLVALVDDLDTAARIDGGQAADPAITTDAGSIVEEVADRHRIALAARGVDLAVRTESVAVAIAPQLVERMTARLLASAAGLAAAGETVTMTLAAGNGHALYSVSRPVVLAGRDERALLDPDYTPDGDWPDAPLLGLGFTLRLVGRLATQSGGSLAIRPDRFDLSLPTPHVCATAL